jgi:heterodisulfide reductase subunit B
MKTAVEWLVEEINKLTGLTIQMDEPIIEQAKQMEKEQIMDACKQCSYSYEEAEQYYKENFKSE